MEDVEGAAEAGFETVSVLLTIGLAAVAASALLTSEGEAVAAPADDSPVSVLTSVGAVLFLPAPSLKSVTYQPVPLSWKPAAVSCFLKVAAPHSGQSVNSGSDIFCKTSLACPQVSHL